MRTDVVAGAICIHVTLRRHVGPSIDAVDTGSVVSTVERRARGGVSPCHGAAWVIGQVPVGIKPGLIHRPEAWGVVVDVAIHPVAGIALIVIGDRVDANARALTRNAGAAVAEVAGADAVAVVAAHVHGKLVGQNPVEIQGVVAVVPIVHRLRACMAWDGTVAIAVGEHKPIGDVANVRLGWIRQRSRGPTGPLVGPVLTKHHPR